MTILTTAIPAQVWAGEGKAVDAHCAIEWDRRDPTAISLTFTQGLDDPVTWIAARQLLIDGLASEDFVGAGDFACCARRGEFRVHVKSPDGEAVVWMPRQQVDSLISGTQRMVPPNSDQECVIVERAFDKQLTAFLDGSPS